MVKFFKKIDIREWLLLLILISFQSIAQTGIGTATPNASAKLDVYATNKGFLPPRVTLTSATDNTTIASPAEGLLVYNLGSVGLLAGYYYWNGANWATIATASLAGTGVTATNLVNLYSKGYSTAAGDIANTSGYSFTVPVSGRYLFDFSSSSYASGAVATLSFKVRQGTTDIGTDAQTGLNNTVHVEYNGKVEVNLQAGTTYNVIVTTTGNRDSGDYDRVYMKQVSGNLPINQYTIGDVKTGMQSADHNGWIKLDGRAKSSLSSTQQTQATLLGIGTNLPNATNAFLVQNGTTLGSLSGSNSKIIAQTNLPNINFPTATTSTNGDHSHYFNRPNGDQSYSNGSGNTWWGGSWGSTNWTSTAGAHTHTVTVSSGGSGTALDITPQSLSVTTFIYLGN